MQKTDLQFIATVLCELSKNKVERLDEKSMNSLNKVREMVSPFMEVWLDHEGYYMLRASASVHNRVRRLEMQRASRKTVG